MASLTVSEQDYQPSAGRTLIAEMDVLDVDTAIRCEYTHPDGWIEDLNDDAKGVFVEVQVGGVWHRWIGCSGPAAAPRVKNQIERRLHACQRGLPTGAKKVRAYFLNPRIAIKTEVRLFTREAPREISHFKPPASVGISATGSSSVEEDTTVTIGSISSSGADAIWVGIGIEGGSETVSTIKHNGTDVADAGTPHAANTPGSRGQAQGFGSTISTNTTGDLVLVASDANDMIGVQCIMFSGVDQTTPFTGWATGQGNNGSPAVAVASTESDEQVPAVCFQDQNQSLAIDTPATSVGAESSSTWNICETGGYQAGTGGTVTTTWTTSASERWAAVGVRAQAAAAGGVVRVVDETQQIAEARTAHRDRVDVITQTQQIVETPIVHRDLVNLYGEVQQIVEGVIAHRARLAVVDEVIQIAEGVIASLGKVDVVDETIQIQEGVLDFRGRVQVVSETIQIVEAAPLLVRALTRFANEMQQIVESVLEHRDRVDVISETINVVEGVIAHRGRLEIVDETINIVEDVVESIGTSVLVEVVDEVQQIVESILEVRALVRFVNETQQIVEGSTTLKIVVYIVDETINILEGLVEIIPSGNLVKVYDETVNLVESVLELTGIARQVDETQQIQEGVIAHRARLLIVDEIQQIVENLVLAQALLRIVDETQQIVEAVLVHRARLLIVTETQQIVEAVAAAIGKIQAITETINISETFARATGIARAYTETINVVETLARASAVLRIYDETQQIVESLLRPRTLVRLVDETIEIAEGVIRRLPILTVSAIGAAIGWAFPGRLKGWDFPKRLKGWTFRKRQ